MKFPIFILPLLSLPFAAASPTQPAPTPQPYPTATPTQDGPAAQCLYASVAPSSTAYAAAMPNNNLTEDAIYRYYSNYVFTCQVNTNFTAHRLTGTHTRPKPWFGAIVYPSFSPCFVGGFEGIVGAAMQYENENGNWHVECLPFTGHKKDAFHVEAGKYFASVKKNY